MLFIIAVFVLYHQSLLLGPFLFLLVQMPLEYIENKSYGLVSKSIHAYQSISNILFVDAFCKYLISITNDFIVDTFSNPLEVISAFQPELYDLLLIDIKMPKMNGFELYQELRKKADNVEIRACFITSYEIYYETLKSEFPELNVGCFINEHIESANLVKRIRRITNTSISSFYNLFYTII